MPETNEIKVTGLSYSDPCKCPNCAEVKTEIANHKGFFILIYCEPSFATVEKLKEATEVVHGLFNGTIQTVPEAVFKHLEPN